MEIRTLAGCSVQQVATAFNEAFSDYFIPLSFSEAGMEAKMKSENILLQYSAGAFEGRQLVGFILHGYDVINSIPTIYNAGTGVVTASRGKHITRSLYNFIIPLLKNEGIFAHQLEVIENNIPAYKTYDQVGFSTTRTLGAYKGKVSPSPGNFDVRPIDISDVKAAEFFCEISPTWQNSTASIARGIDEHNLIGVFDNEELVAFAAYVPSAARVRQFAVKPSARRRGFGKALFNFIASECKADVTIVNVDESNEGVLSFLTSLGFERILGLYEMKMMVQR